MRTYQLGIIGGGIMGQAIARGAVHARIIDPARLIVADSHPDRFEEIGRIGCRVTTDPTDVLDTEHLLLAVKPQQFGTLMASLPPLAHSMIVYTIMAGIHSTTIRDHLGEHARVVRMMPNTPCQVGEGMTGIALGAGAQPGDEHFAHTLFEALGKTVTVDESLMHAVTAVSGSGPAYVYLLAELMEQAAAQLGFDDATAQLLVVQTIIGAGRMLREQGDTPAVLRKRVTTPNGTTAAAMDVMLERDLPGTLIDALRAARDRGEELGRM